MAKWKSVKLKEGQEMPDGSRKYGEAVWVPVNEAAKAHKLSQEAIDKGVYKPKEGELPEEVAKRLRKREAEAMAKGLR